MHHSLHCLDNTGCETDRSVGGDSSWRFACLFQRENVGFLPDSGHNTFGEALIEDGEQLSLDRWTEWLEKGRGDVVRARGAFPSHDMYGYVEFSDGEGRTAGFSCSRQL